MARANRMSWTIPETLSVSTTIRTADFVSLFRDNQLTGEIPVEVANLVTLEALEPGNNRLSGDIPAELSSLTNLVNLILGGL